MLSISKIALAGAGAYVEYLTGEAAREAGTSHITHDDQGALASYYEVDQGGARWFGALSPEPGAGLTPDDFAAMLNAVDPATGEPLAPDIDGRKVAAYDLVMSAPKSVSLLAELSDDDTRATVQAAHDEAVSTALEELERWATYLRRGKHGREVIAAEGLMGVSVRHHTSRASDPQLHTHNVVSSLSRDAEGRWSSLDGQALYALAALGGAIYQQQLRHRLTAELGVEWAATEKGLAELEGIPPEALAQFSKRRSEILDAVDTGASRASRQVAAYDTRDDKDNISLDELRERWATELEETVGLSRDDLLEYARDTPGRDDRPDPGTWREDAAAHLASPEGLTAHKATFDARDAARAMFDHAPADVGAREVLAAGREFISDQIHVETARPRAASSWAFRKHTTQEMARVEERMWETAKRLSHPGRVAAAADAETMEAAATEAGLTPEQTELLREAVTTGRGLVNAVGVAGSGKTHAMKTAAELWHADGRTTIATATAARVAVDLAQGAGLAHGASLTALLGEFDRGDRTLNAGDVVIVDEAGMAETRHLDRLLRAADQAGAQVVAVGDWVGQLQAIGAGGAQRDMTELPGTIRLETTMRAEQEWERDAQVAWRQGGLAAVDALETYRERGRIDITDDRDDARAQLLDRWWEDLHPTIDGDEQQEPVDPTSVLMLAGRRADVHHLNDAARERRITAGEVNPQRSTTAVVLRDDSEEVEHEFDVAAGDRVVLRRNDRDLGILNGQRGRVDTVHRDGGITVRIDDGGTVQLPADYLVTGGLRLGYAQTAHSAQGTTVDRAHVLADQMLTRQWGYSAMTRGRADNHMVFVADPFDDRDHDRQLHDAWLDSEVEQTARSVMRDDLNSYDLERARSRAAAEGLDLNDDQLTDLAVDLRLRREHARVNQRGHDRERDRVLERGAPDEAAA